MSSTAIPLAFPPHRFLDDIFVDGGVSSNILLTEGMQLLIFLKQNKFYFVLKLN